jgi:NADP-dependent alcohol dehydrogenase
MNNFTFYNDTRIEFGRQAIQKLTGLTASYKKVLMVYGGGSIKKNGVYEQVTAALKHNDVREFSGVLPNPEYDLCMQAVPEARQADLVLAVGGGSVVDACKFICAAACYRGDDPWDILDGGVPVKAAKPLGTVLTLPATGSEMNMNAVISRSSQGKKLAFSSEKVLPRFSVLDPGTSRSLDARQTGNGVVDAFVHVMEQYLTYPVNAPLQYRFAESILLTLIEEGPKVLNKPDDYDVRANIMWCATLALNHLIGSGVIHDWATHMIGHELTVRFGLDHAQTLAIVLPAMIRHQKNQKAEMLDQYGRRVWGLSDGDDVIEGAIQNTANFFEGMGVATHLGHYSITPSDCDEIGEVLENRNGKIGERQDIGASEIRAILSLAR